MPAQPETLARTFCDPDFTKMCHFKHMGMHLVDLSRTERSKAGSDAYHTATYHRHTSVGVTHCVSACSSVYIFLGDGNHVAITWPATTAAKVSGGKVRVQEEMFVLCREKVRRALPPLPRDLGGTPLRCPPCLLCLWTRPLKLNRQLTVSLARHTQGDGTEVVLHHEMQLPESADNLLSAAERRLEHLRGKLASKVAKEAEQLRPPSFTDALKGRLLVPKVVSEAVSDVEALASGTLNDVTSQGRHQSPCAEAAAGLPVGPTFMRDLTSFLQSRKGRAVLERNASWHDPYHGPMRLLLQPVHWMAAACSG